MGAPKYKLVAYEDPSERTQIPQEEYPENVLLKIKEVDPIVQAIGLLDWEGISHPYAHTGLVDHLIYHLRWNDKLWFREKCWRIERDYD